MADVRKERPEEEIQVTDRRSFNRDGERVRPELDETGPAPAGDAALPTGPDFGTFVMGLAKIALLHLGDEPDASGPPSPVDLPAAREMIDILGMLREKTAGNLTPEEEHLLETLLYELRMDFTQKATAR